MKPKTIEGLYKNMKQMPYIAIASLFIPVIMLLVLPVTWLFMFQRRKLLKIEPQILKTMPGVSSREVEYIRDKGWILWLPSIMIPINLTAVIIIARM